MGGKGKMHGNIKPAMYLPLLRGLLEMLARLTTWEHMQRGMKKSKPYLLNLVDLGKRERRKTRKQKQVWIKQPQCSVLQLILKDRKRTIFIQNIQQNMKTKRSTHQSPAVRENESSIYLLGFLCVPSWNRALLFSYPLGSWRHRHWSLKSLPTRTILWSYWTFAP